MRTIKYLLSVVTVCYFMRGFAFPALQDMNLDEKIGQLLMVHFHGETANEEAKILIQEVYIGGIIYYNWANGLQSPQQVRDLSLGLQKLAQSNRTPIPLFIAADQEGGLVARLNKGFTIFPGNKALGFSQDLLLAESSARAMGKELLAVGVNLNLAPVVDINSNPKNPIIGIRSFGDASGVVIPFARKALEGFHKAGIMTTLKHFPGHGDVEVDSHVDLPVVKKTKTELEKMELLPFMELANQTDAVMTAHVVAMGLDPVNCTTLSKPSLDYLRNEIGFQGVIISDSLVMEGVLKNCPSIDEAAIKALQAGCDMLILGGKQLLGSQASLELTVADVQRIHRSISEAVKNGRLPLERIHQAVEKIIALKLKYSLENFVQQDGNLAGKILTQENQSLAYQIATAALRQISHSPLDLPPLNQLKIAYCAPELIREALYETSFMTLGKDRMPLFFSGLNPTQNEMNEALEKAVNADLVIFFSYNAWKYGSQASLIDQYLNTGKPVIVISLRDFQDVLLFPKVPLLISTSSPTAISIQAAFDWLQGEFYE